MKRCLPILVLALVAACHPVRKPPVPAVVTNTDHTPAVENDTKRAQSVDLVVSGPAKPPHVEASEHKPEPSEVTAILRDLSDRLQDAFFDYDRSALRPEALAALEEDARILAPALAGFPQLSIIIEGHCDERRSAEYNIGLGDHRAQRASEVLYQSGIARDRIQVVSYGKEAPQCRESNATCWQRNRRAHVVLRAATPTE